MLPQYPGPAGPAQPSGFHGLTHGSMAPPPVDPAAVAAYLANNQGGGNGVQPNGQPMPPGDFPGNMAGTPPPPAGAVMYEDGSVGPAPTPTAAVATATGFPQSPWSAALGQRMANGGIGSPMDFYNFVRNRGAMPTPDGSAPAAQPMAAAPRPLVIGPTNNSPAQIIPQSAPSGPGGMSMPAMPPSNLPMPNVAQPAIQRPVTPGQIPGGVPQNPQMPGFFPQGRGVR